MFTQTSTGFGPGFDKLQGSADVQQNQDTHCTLHILWGMDPTPQESRRSMKCQALLRPRLLARQANKICKTCLSAGCFVPGQKDLVVLAVTSGVFVVDAAESGPVCRYGVPLENVEARKQMHADHRPQTTNTKLFDKSCKTSISALHKLN